LEKELTDLEKINKMVQEKLTNTQNEIAEIEQQISKVKERVEHSEAQIVTEPTEEKVIKKKDAGCQVARRQRRSRRDWVGKF
jgi:chromosome segregation ATPase